MDGVTNPGWGSGYNLVASNPLPASFVTYFPAAQATKTETSWADMFVVQKPPAIARAWSRIPVPAGPSTLRKGMIIMKRVGRARAARQTVAASPAATETEEAVEDLEETQRANRRRLGSFVPPAEEALLELVGEPLSFAEMASAIMRAKVAVANCYLHEDYTELSKQKSLAKQSQYSKKTVPLKRRFNDHSSIAFEYASGGNGAAIYSELRPILVRAMHSGVAEIDVHMASIIEAGVHMRSGRRNPRISLAASGAPDLSDIADESEPSSILTLEPNEPMSDAKSPTKRASTQSPSPTKSNKSFRKRLSDTIVRLLPGSSPRAEPSPTKPCSPPSPGRVFGSPRNRTPSVSTPKSPSRSKSPILSANSTPGLVRKTAKESPFARWRPKRKSEPARLVASSPLNEYSNLDYTMEESSFLPESPTHQSRPQAPTPSKWSGLVSSSPNHKSSPVAATYTSDEASLDLVKSLPDWMQHSQSPAIENHNASNIEFRPASPSFTSSVPWVNSPLDAVESERTKIVRRRKSEPLVRNVLKTQTSRRISLSPQKDLTSDPISGAIPTTIDEPASPNEDINIRPSALSEASEPFITRFSERSAVSEPLITQSAEHSEAFIPSPTTQANAVDNTMAQELEDMESSEEYRNAFPTTLSTISGLYRSEIDSIWIERMSAPRPVRHPDDVFDDPNDSYRMPSPPPRDPVKTLARMAENGCYDKATATVSRTEERLLVQFKLPLKYFDLFPKDQDNREPPSPGRPEVTFHRELEAPAPFPRERSEWDSSDEDVHPADATLAVPEVVPSPSKRNASLPAENGEIQPADETFGFSEFVPSPSKRSSPAEHEESHIINETLVVSDFGGSPSKRRSLPAENEDSHLMNETFGFSEFIPSSPKRRSSPTENEEIHPAAKTSSFSDFGASPTKQWPLPADYPGNETFVLVPSPPNRSSLPAENEESLFMNDTLIVSDFNVSPATRNSSSQGIAGSSSAFAQKAPFTPLDQHIIPDYLDTSERKAYKPNTNPAPMPPVSSEPPVIEEPIMSSDSSPLSDLENTPPLNPSSELSIANMIAANQAEQSTTTHVASSPISFTPVNQASAQEKAASSAQPIHDDSPERDYLRDFIKRSKPRRPTTTRKGSPIAPERLPLGARSPNMETQPKEKRKLESSEGEENESAPEAELEPAPKRVRRMPRATPPKRESAATNDLSSDEIDELANTEEQEEAPVATASRRSSRLKAKPSAIPKSAIPTPAKVGRGRPLGSVRNEQQDLVHQTRANTRRNKGNAEYPAQVLARQSSDEEGEGEGEDEAEAPKARRGKSVVWREPLASYQEEEKPKRGRAAATKAKAKVAGSRVAKPAPKPSAAQQKQRSTRIAAGLGMAGNGTPAPKRATRASTRTRK